jgi:competence protein ComEA
MTARIVTLSLLAALVAAPALATASSHAASATAAGDAKININTAPARELQKLEGVGHSVAERIVRYREEHGPFKRGEDIRKVDGIGGTLWEKNRERIVVK